MESMPAAGKSAKKSKLTSSSAPSVQRSGGGSGGAFASIFAKANEREATKSRASPKSSKAELAGKLKPQKPVTPVVAVAARPEPNVPPTDLAKASLILFDEVDVVLNDDRGFWNAVETFMSITKRPIILTASDLRVVNHFPVHVELLKLHVPQFINTASYLQTICLVEGVRTSFADILSFVSMCSGDVRRALLSLQCWVESGAAPLCHRLRQPVYVAATETSPQDVLRPSVAPVEPCSGAATGSKPSVVSSAVGVVKESDSEDDFVKSSRRRQRRRCTRNVISDDDSQTLDGNTAKTDKEPAADFDDGSQSTSQHDCGSVVKRAIFIDDDSQSQSCIPAAWDDGKVPRLVALDTELAPHLHRLEFALFKDVCSHQSSLMNCTHVDDSHPLWTSSFWLPKQPFFDSTLPFVHHCGPDNPTLKPNLNTTENLHTLYAAYRSFSTFDCTFGRCLADRDSHVDPGNSDALLREDGPLPAVCQCGGVVDELQSLLLDGRLLCGAGKEQQCQCKSNMVDDDDKDAKWFDIIQKDIGRFDKLAQQVKLTTDYVRCHHVGVRAPPLVIDYLPALRAIAKSEVYRQATNSKRRFYHYLRSTFPDLKSSILNQLSTSFSLQ
jgi:hypothetical protein